MAVQGDLSSESASFLLRQCPSKARLRMLGQSQASCVELYSSQATECLLSGGLRGLLEPSASAAESLPFPSSLQKGHREKDSLVLELHIWDQIFVCESVMDVLVCSISLEQSCSEVSDH